MSIGEIILAIVSIICVSIIIIYYIYAKYDNKDK